MILGTWIFDCTEILKLQLTWSQPKKKKNATIWRANQAIGVWCKHNDIRNGMISAISLWKWRRNNENTRKWLANQTTDSSADFKINRLHFGCHFCIRALRAINLVARSFITLFTHYLIAKWQRQSERVCEKIIIIYMLICMKMACFTWYVCALVVWWLEFLHLMALSNARNNFVDKFRPEYFGKFFVNLTLQLKWLESCRPTVFDRVQNELRSNYHYQAITVV